MLRQVCRRGHLTAFIQDCIASGNPLGNVLHILVPQAPQTCTGAELPPVSPLAEAQHNGQGKNLPLEVYNLILAHLNGPPPLSPVHHFKNLPHPMDVYVLPRMAAPTHHIKHKGHDYSTFSMHPGNSSISYHSKDGAINAGFVTSMWTQVLMGKLHSFIVVSPHKLLLCKSLIT
jgi:hypothetical protein